METCSNIREHVAFPPSGHPLETIIVRLGLVPELAVRVQTRALHMAVFHQHQTVAYKGRMEVIQLPLIVLPKRGGWRCIQLPLIVGEDGGVYSFLL